MKCPSCGVRRSLVLRTTAFADNVAICRRRECQQCGARFTSYEFVVADKATAADIAQHGVKAMRTKKERNAAATVKKQENKPAPAAGPEALLAFFARRRDDS